VISEALKNFVYESDTRHVAVEWSGPAASGEPSRPPAKSELVPEELTRVGNAVGPPTAVLTRAVCSRMG
jgi:hypothetical protein